MRFYMPLTRKQWVGASVFIALGIALASAVPTAAMGLVTSLLRDAFVFVPTRFERDQLAPSSRFKVLALEDLADSSDVPNHPAS